MRRPGSNDDDVQGERVSVAAGKTANVRLVVESRSGVINGKVTDEQGEPVVDAWVITSRESEAAGAVAGGAGRQTRWQWGSDDRPVITATDGSFTVRELAPGTYAVRAFRRGGGEAVSEHVKVGATVALVIKSTGTISGVVKVAGGVLPDEVFISLGDEQTGFSRREKFFRTGGTFAMRDLPAGSFLLTADASAGRVMTTVVLAAGQRKTDVVLTLERKVTVRGRMVELGTGTPVPGLYANVQPVKGGRGMGWGGGGADKEYISGEDGRFEVKNAATGRVWVSGWPTDWEKLAVELHPRGRDARRHHRGGRRRRHRGDAQAQAAGRSRRRPRLHRRRAATRDRARAATDQGGAHPRRRPGGALRPPGRRPHRVGGRHRLPRRQLAPRLGPDGGPRRGRGHARHRARRHREDQGRPPASDPRV